MKGETGLIHLVFIEVLLSSLSGLLRNVFRHLFFSLGVSRNCLPDSTGLWLLPLMVQASSWSLTLKLVCTHFVRRNTSSMYMRAWWCLQ